MRTRLLDDINRVLFVGRTMLPILASKHMANNAGVPILTRADIEAMASRVICWLDARRLERPSLTPVAEIVDRLVRERKLAYRTDVDLGVSWRGRKILGMFQFEPRAIFIDPSIAQVQAGSRFRFTLAHELGHFVLHRRCTLEWDALDMSNNRVTDSRDDLHFLRRKSKTRTARDWLEWQANFFAASLLVPSSTLQEAIAEAQREAGVTRRLGRIYVDDQKENWVLYRRIQYHLQEVYQVSRSMVVIRLRELRLVEDKRTFSPLHIARLFMEQ